MSNYNTADVLGQYRNAKRDSLRLAESLKRMGMSKWSTVAFCSEHIEMVECPECGRRHVNAAWCCKHRLCAICALRRSRKLGGQALDAFLYMQQRGQLDNVRLFLLTLTQKNVCGEMLGSEINKLLESLKKIRYNRNVRRYVTGSAKNIEITYNAGERTYHPHVHMIVFLDNSAPDSMRKSRYWRDLWREIMQLEYEPICDLREISEHRGAVCEVSKYCIKPSSIFRVSLSDDEMDEVIWTIDGALSRRQLVSYTGIWRTARAELKQREPDEDLEHESTDDICGCGAEFVKAVFEWNGLEYVKRVHV